MRFIRLQLFYYPKKIISILGNKNKRKFLDTPNMFEVGARLTLSKTKEGKRKHRICLENKETLLRNFCGPSERRRLRKRNNKKRKNRRPMKSLPPPLTFPKFLFQRRFHPNLSLFL